MATRFRTALLLSALLALLLFGTAYAYVITIDGNPSEWQLSMNETPPELGLEEDPDSISGEVDIAEYWATNDSLNLYYRLDTWLDTDWNSITVFAVCMDVDPAMHASCGAGWGCDSAADFALVIDPLASTVELLDADTCLPVPGAVPDAASDGPVTEISVPFAGLGLNSTNCDFDCYVNTQVILQYGIDQNEADLFPDTGYFPQAVGGGSPTSLGLTSFSAETSPTGNQPGLAQTFILAAALLMLLVVVAWRRALTYPK